MAKKMSRKELLKSEDEFLTLSARAIGFFQKNVKLLQGIGIGVAAAFLLYLGGYFYLQHVNKKGQEAYNEAYQVMLEAARKQEGSAELLRKAEGLFEKVIQEYGLSEAADLAVPQVAYLKYRMKEYDEAISLYKKYMEEVDGEDSTASLTRIALSACHEEKGDYGEAISVLNPLMSRPDEPFTETAMLSLARLYRLDGQPEKARELLKEFVDTYQNSPFLAMAKAQLS